MNASSVSSYSSDLWEEYLEQLKKQQLQESAATTQASSAAGKKASAPGLSPDQILSELLELQDDPEQLKERAAALAAEVTEEAGSAVGMRADMLSELAGDLETVAESGDLSVIQEKLARRHGGPGGAANIAAKLAEASLEEDEDDDETSASTLESIKALLAEIQKLIEKEERAGDTAQAESGHLTPEGILSELEGLQETPETLKARASELAGQLYSEAEGASGPRARIIAALASDLETVAESGDLSALEEKIERKP
ncbi:MAG: hypothetical protein LBL73_08645, partial [Synergistaceae bacterium]|nr:hypothetical protein [Synergistaceae bacterium]